MSALAESPPRVDSDQPAKSSVVAVLLLLFFLSGAAALVYEVVWTRKAIDIFGSTLHSTSTVLAVFMGGLAAGAFLFGRMADAPKTRPLLYFAVLELGIGAYALLTPALFQLVQAIQVSLYEALSPDHPALGLTRFLMLAAILAPPTVFMGGTLPLMVRFFVRRREVLGRWIGHLYFLNTAGAVVGTLLSAFLLIALIGLDRAIYVAAAVDIAIGVAVLGLQRGVLPIAPVELAPEPPPGIQAEETKHRRGRRGRRGRSVTAVVTAFAPTPLMFHLLVLAVAVSGAASLSLQVSWTRALILVVGSSVYAFGLMLAAFLTGIALGSLLASTFADRLRNPWPMFALLQLGIGASILAFSSYLDQLPLLLVMNAYGLSEDSFWALQPVLLGLIFLVMLVPTTLMGAAFPLAIKLWNRSLSHLGRSVGYLYFVNTAGALVGALATGFLLIPTIGMEWSIRLAALLYATAGAALWLANAAWLSRSRWLLAATAGAVIALAIVVRGWDREMLSAGAYLRIGAAYEAGLPSDPRDLLATGEIVYFKEGRTATVSVERTVDNLALIINGKPDASLTPGDMGTQILLGHLPMLLHPDPRNVLVVGLGSGITVGSTLRYPVERVEVVEIEEAVVEASRFFEQHNGGALHDPRTTLIVADAQTYVAASPLRYDVIVAEPSNPWMKGLANLFTQEQFERYSRKLNDEGVVIQWLHLDRMSAEDIRVVAATFRSVFPHATLWSNPSGTDGFFVGTKSPLSIDYSRLQDLIALPEVRDDMARGSVEDPVTLLSLFVMGEEPLGDFASGAPMHTANHPRLDYSAPTHLYSATLADNLALLNTYQDDLLPYLSNVQLPGRGADESTQEVRERLALAVESRRATAMGVAAASGRDPEEIVSLFLEALELNPRNLAARTFLGSTYLNLGNQAMRAGDSAARTTWHERAVDVAPHFAAARRVLASTYAEEGRLEDAVAQLRTLLDAHPDDALARAVLGAYLLRLGDAGQAETELLEAVHLDPSLYDVHNVLGTMYLQQGRQSEAIRHLQWSLQANPDQPEVHALLAR